MADLSVSFDPLKISAASDAASDAISKADAVSDVASNALSKAIVASGAAAAVSDAASNALSKANLASAAASNALSKATVASGAAAAVSDVASNALSKATAASAAVATISDAASNALSIATLAQSKASDASSAAVVAQSKASDASSAAVYATKMAVLNPTPADVSATGMIVSLAASEALAFGQPIYINAQGFAAKADANAAGLYPAVGIAISTIASAATGKILLHGIARNDAWNWTPGAVLYLSTTAGVITATQPAATDNVVQVLGVATHADRMYFKPSADYITHT